MEHLSRALPTGMIFFLFRYIRSDHFKCGLGYPTESKRDTLEIIVKWLMGLGSEGPSDLHDRFRDELLEITESGALDYERNQRIATRSTIYKPPSPPETHQEGAVDVDVNMSQAQVLGSGTPVSLGTETPAHCDTMESGV